MNDIAYKNAIRSHIEDIYYPAHLIVYGPEKHYISSHNRSEYCSVFGEQYCVNELEAIEFIDRLNYEGGLNDLKIVWIETKVNTLG